MKTTWARTRGTLVPSPPARMTLQRPPAMKGSSQNLSPPQSGTSFPTLTSMTRNGKTQAPEAIAHQSGQASCLLSPSQGLSHSGCQHRCAGGSLSHLAEKGMMSEAVCLPGVTQVSWEGPFHMQPVRPNRSTDNRVWDGAVPRKTILCS